MEIPKDNKEKLPPKKSIETVTLPMSERDRQTIGVALYELGDRLQAYAEPDTIGVHIRKTVLREALPDGFDSIEPTRVDVEMRHTETKNGGLSAELDINGAKVVLHPDPSGEIPGIWSVTQKGSEQKLLSHDELLYGTLANYLPRTKQLESLLDRPVIEDGDMLRVLTDSLVAAGAKRETHAKYSASDIMLQGDFSHEGSFFDTTIGSEVVISHVDGAIRYGCITKQSFEIADFSAVQLNSLVDTDKDIVLRGDATEQNEKISYGSVDSTYRFGVIMKKDGKFNSEAQLLTESDSIPARNLMKIAKQAEITGVPASVFTHTIENVANRYFPEDTETYPTEERL